MLKAKPSAIPQGHANGHAPSTAARLTKAIAHPPPTPAPFKRLILDIPASDHVRFKAICALHGTTMTSEINAFLAAQFATPDTRLTEALYLRVSPSSNANSPSMPASAA
jgi:hypothetical protein